MFLYKRSTFSIQFVMRWLSLIVVIGLWLWYACNIYQNIHPEISQQPLQLLKSNTEISSLVLGKQKLDIQVVGRITLWGVITSMSNQEFINKYNMISLCLLWGNNLSLYKQGNYTCWHKDGRCMLKINKENRNQFIIKDFSNNHILLPTQNLQNKAKLLHVGDQIKISGDLVNIKKQGLQNWLNTSIIRSDVGDGACEIILPEQIEILLSNGGKGSILLHAMFLVLSIGILFFEDLKYLFRRYLTNKKDDFNG